MRSSTTLLAIFAVVLVQCCGSSHSASKMPHYIKACSRNDPNLNACGLKNGREAYPYIIKGDRKYGIPVLEPLHLPKFVVDQHQGAVGIGFTATDIKITGLQDGILDDIKLDVDKNHYELTITAPVFTATALYDVTGKILILPIKGNGDANITMTQVTGTYKFDLELFKGPDGQKYGRPINTELTYLINGRLYVTLNNLFNGDKLLGNAMNEFINENWRDIESEMGPSISAVLQDVITSIITNIFQKVPVKDAFPETD